MASFHYPGHSEKKILHSIWRSIDRGTKVTLQESLNPKTQSIHLILPAQAASSSLVPSIAEH